MALNDKLESVRERVDTLLDECTIANVPGIQYVVVNKNEALYEYSGGFSDVKEQTLMEGNNTMMAYSLTKVFTAAAVLQLCEQGKIKLDEPVDNYIAGLPYQGDITIRHLLTHTSGIPNPSPLKWCHTVDEHNSFNEEDTLDEVLAKHMVLKFKPGEKYLYSNIGYWLLGKVIEKVSGFSFSEYMRINVLKPIGLFSSELDFVINDFSGHAKGYLLKLSLMNMFKYMFINRNIVGKYEGRWLNIKKHYLNGPAFGGMVGSARSISRFLHDQLKDESVLFQGECKRMFYTKHKLKNGKEVNVSLGWNFGYENKTGYYYKQGGGVGFRSEMRIYPEFNIATIVMTNRTFFRTKSFLNKIDREFFNFG